MSDSTATTPTEGWQWPGLAGKAHYFRGGQSLCRRWMLTSQEFQGGLDSPPSKSDCVACRRLVDAECAR